MEKIDFIKCGSCLNVLKDIHSVFKVSATLNPYINCMYSCVYCPFAKTNRVGVKTDYLHFLEKNLSEGTQKYPIGFGSMTEPYSDLEKKYNLTHHSLEIIIKHKYPVHIFTKSNTILRDIELLRSYSGEGLLAVTVSISTSDNKLSQLLEPDINILELRLNLLQELKKQGILAGITLAPIIPFINDSASALEEVFDFVKSDARYILPGVFNIDSNVHKEKITEFISNKYPKHKDEFLELYNGKIIPDSLYSSRINEVLDKLSKEYNIPLNMPLENEVPCHTDIAQELLK
ncbi:MAG: hypothetical protein LHV68_12615 [Elusimicrobia bacterium]|nr:hypothetical protein [Candidatus Liberimonas magnetica]